MNKSKFSEKLLAGFLVLICFLSLILVPSAGSISENAGPETHRELFAKAARFVPGSTTMRSR